MTAYEISKMGRNPRYYCSWSQFHEAFLIRDSFHYKPDGLTHVVVAGTDSPHRDLVLKAAKEMNYEYYGLNK